jgi:hypothetical protein
LYTAFSKVSVFEELSLWIYALQDCLSIGFMRGCEDDKFELLGKFLQNLFAVRSDINTCLNLEEAIPE